MRLTRGFTLVELLVSVAIIVAFSGIMLPQLSKFRNQQSLQNSAAEMLSALQNTKTNALNGAQCGSDLNPTMRASSWDLTLISNQSYRVEPECLLNDEPQPALPKKDYSTAKDVIIDRVYINSTDCSGVSNPRVTFSNISGTIDFTNLGVGCDSLVNNTAKMLIVLRSASNNSTMAVIIEKGGRMYVGAAP